MTLTHLPKETGFYDFCYFIKNNNFDNCCVFLIVQSTSNILVTWYFKKKKKNNTSNASASWRIFSVSFRTCISHGPSTSVQVLQMQEDGEVKTCRVVILSLQPLGSRGTSAKMERQGRAFMESEHAAALPACPQQDTQLIVPLSWGMNSLTAQNC